MNRRLLTILFIAFVIAGACAFLVYRMVGNRLVASKPSTTRIVAASKDISLGAILTSSDLTTTQIAGPLPQGAILNFKDAIGRGAISEIYQGEPILQNRLAAPGSGGGLAATIPDGMRAIAVKVDQVVGVAGFVTPGMRVDVIVSGTPPGTGNNEGTVSRTILQDIEVLSAGTDIQRDATGKPQQVQVVNLMVTPDQAQTLSLASGQGVRIQLVLRNPLDRKVNKVPTTAMSNLFGEQGQAPVHYSGGRRVRRAAPKTYSIEVINGSQRSEEKVGSAGGKH
ncbi:MAG: Flp pilus assembly protein CpaB [Terracidiphilus sp.]